MLHLTFQANNYHNFNFVLGTLLKGTIARLTLCLAASLIRSYPLATGRISSDKPISPTTTKYCGSSTVSKT